MNLSKILPTIAAVAPSIAAALGGPLAGMGVQMLAETLGIEARDAAAMEKAVLGMSPEMLAKVKAADQGFAARMRELDIDLDRIAAADRDSARAMQTKTRDWTPRLLACLITVGFFGLLGMMTFHALPEANEAALYVMLGALSAAFTGVMSFYFGSSAGSQGKDATIAAAVKR